MPSFELHFFNRRRGSTDVFCSTDMIGLYHGTSVNSRRSQERKCTSQFGGGFSPRNYNPYPLRSLFEHEDIKCKNPSSKILAPLRIFLSVSASNLVSSWRWEKRLYITMKDGGKNWLLIYPSKDSWAISHHLLKEITWLEQYKEVFCIFLLLLISLSLKFSYSSLIIAILPFYLVEIDF